MKNIRILVAGMLTLFASSAIAASLPGSASHSEDFSISLSEGYELFSLDDDTAFASDRFGPAEKHFISAKVQISPIGMDGAQESSVAPVPVPSAVWLFGSGLIGLVVVARRRS